MAYKQYSAKMLASEFNKDKVLSRKWTDDKITKIIENKIYYGTFERFGVEYPDHTDSIITKELYDIANQNLQKKWQSSRNKYLYKKLVICKHCVKTMACSSSKPSSGITHLYYRCTTCKKHVAESRITAEYQETFESMMKESQYQEEMAKILDSDPDMYTAIMTIPYSVIMGDQLSDQILGKFKPDSVTLKVFAQTIRVIRASLKRRSYDRMSFPDKRKFLMDSVQTITYDYEKDEISIKFRSE